MLEWWERTQRMWWNIVIKASFERKVVLGARDEISKERCMEAYNEEKRKLKRCIYKRK